MVNPLFRHQSHHWTKCPFSTYLFTCAVYAHTPNIHTYTYVHAMHSYTHTHSYIHATHTRICIPTDRPTYLLAYMRMYVLTCLHTCRSCMHGTQIRTHIDAQMPRIRAYTHTSIQASIHPAIHACRQMYCCISIYLENASSEMIQIL